MTDFQANNSVESDKYFFESFDLERFLYVLRRGKFWVIGFLILIVSLAYLYVRYTKPLYKSESVIKLEFQSEANALGLAEALNTQELNEISGEIELIKSRLFFLRVVKSATLDVSYHLYGRYLTDERYDNAPFVVSHKIINENYYDYPFDLEIENAQQFYLVYSKNGMEEKELYKFGQEITTPDFNLLIEKTEFFSDDLKEDFFFTINSHDALIEYLEQNVEVIPENITAKTIKISLVDHNRHKARELVNLIDVLYLAYTKEVKIQALEQKIKFLDRQIEKTESKLQEHENYFEKFTVKNRTINLNEDLNKTIEQLALLGSQKIALKKKVGDLQSLKNQIDENQAILVNSMSFEEFPKTLEESLDEYIEISQERELKLSSYNETSYIIQQIDLKMNKAKWTLISFLEAYGKSLDDRLSLIESQRATLEEKLSQLPSMRTEYGKTRRVYSLEEEFMLSLQQSKIELEITRAGTVSDNVVLSPASLPNVPIKPKKLLIIVASVVIGLVAGIVFLLLRYLTHNKIAGIRELEKLVTIPVLGAIPMDDGKKLNKTTLVVRKDSKSSLSEALRTIRTNMDFISTTSGPKIISVTSTVPSEGKTFVSANLGAIIAMTNQKVCIIDIDMRKPKIHITFGSASSQDGVSTLISGKSTLEESLQETEIENLNFIAAGPTPPNPSELLLQREFGELLSKLKKDFDVIILDTPPVGLVTDACLVMVKSDIQIYVMRADYSKRSYTKVINDLKDSSQFSNMIAILNAVSSTSGYGYSYGYNYGYYEDFEKKGKLRATIKSLF